MLFSEIAPRLKASAPLMGIAVGWLGACQLLLAAPPTTLALNAASINENSSAGMPAGNLSSTDPDANDTQTYSLVAGAGGIHNSWFEISGALLTLANSPDFEVLGSQLSIRVRVTDSNFEVLERAFTISLTDVRTEDADGDGISEATEEDIHGTSDTLFDSDGDGFGDSYEIARGFLPTNGSSFPQGSLLLGWGGNEFGQATIPAGLDDVLDIAAGTAHSLALRENGTVVAWGRNQQGQCNVPAGLTGVVAIGTGDNHSLAVMANGQVIGWGLNNFGQATAPPGLSNVVAIAAGGRHSLALKSDGQVVVWGADDFFQSTQPSNTTDVISISATRDQCMVVFSNGRVRTWGRNDFSQSLQPEGLSLAIAGASGEKHSLMLKRGGDVVSWGANSEGQLNPPNNLRDAVMICSRGLHNLAIRADRSVVAWGSNSFGQTTVPFEARQAKAIAAGGSHSLVLRRNTGFPEFSNPSLISARVGVPLGHSLTLANATATSFSAMVLPQGLALNPQTGVISGSPLNETRRAFQVFANTSRGRLSQLILMSFGDETPPTGITLTPPRVMENAPAGTVASTIQAIDPDAGSLHVFQLVEGLGDNDNFRFLVSGNQLQVRYGIDVDFESPYDPPKIRLRATDTAGGLIEVALTLEMIDDRSEDDDGDGLSEATEEDIHGTSDKNFDSDGDGISDAIEVQAGTSPVNAAAWPNAPFVAWGLNLAGALQPPFSSGIATLACGQDLCLALRENGGMLAWGGRNSYSQRTIPPNLGDVVSVSAGGNAWFEDAAHSLALKRDGTVVGWGYDFSQQASPPSDLTDVIEISAGRNHSLALKQNGTVVAWGANDYGQIQIPAGLVNVISIAAGGFQNLALKSDGSVTSWGQYFNGEAWQAAVAPEGLVDAVAIATGRFHCLALRPDGTVVAWGNNQFGQTQVPPGLNNVVALAAGGFHSLALKADGSVVGWGMNRNNQSTPPGPALQNIRLISAGLQHSIAIRRELGSPEISSSRQIQAAVGQAMGFPVTVLNATPLTFHAAGLPSGFNIHPTTGVISGTFNAPFRGSLRIVVDTNKGRLVQSASLSGTSGMAPTAVTLSPASITENTVEGTWIGTFSITDPDSGGSVNLRLVNGEGADDNSSFVVHQGRLFVSAQFRRDFETQASPLSIRVRATDATLNSYEQIVTLAFLDDRTEDADRDGLTEAAEEDIHITSDQVADSDGDQFSDGFEVARGTSPKNSASKPNGSMVVSWGREAAGNSSAPISPGELIEISAGRDHSLGLRPNGTVIAWGSNVHGQLQVPNTLVAKVAIAAGGRHGLQLNSTGTVAAWGGNESGQCNVPPNLSGVIAIAAGEAHSLALRSNGTVVAWGWNGYGQGNVPANLSGVIAIAAGGFHSLALKNDGTVVAWGYNSNGVGSVPANALGIIGISAGGYHSLALRSDGTVVAWGHNLYGQCSVPQNLTNVTRMAAGWVHSMVLKADGSVSTWGDLGNGVSVPLEAINVKRISAGYTHSLVLRDDLPVAEISNASSVKASVGLVVSRPVVINGATPNQFSAFGLPNDLNVDAPTGLQTGVIQTGRISSVLLQVDTNRGRLERILPYNTLDGAPLSAIQLSPAAVMENSPAGTSVGTLTATVAGAPSLRNFALVTGPGDGDNFRFQISNGVLSLSGPLGLNFDLPYADPSIRIRASGTGVEVPFEQSLNIQLTNDWSEDSDANGFSEAAEALTAWAGTSGLLGSQRLPSAVPKGDGLSNLLKYAFGLNPAVSLGATGSNSAGLPRFDFISRSQGGVFRYYRRKNCGLIYRPRVTTSLVPGASAPLPGTPEVIYLDGTWEEVRCIVPFAPGGPTRQFFTVEVFLP